MLKRIVVPQFLFVFILVFTIGCQNILAQTLDDVNTTKYIQNYSNLSATAQGFSRINNVPVSPFTGQINVEFPLYQKSIGSASFNISLKNTSGGGIKVEDPGSVVGRGWSLNVGGAIIRNVRGLPDDYYDEYSSNANNTKYNGILFNNIISSRPDGTTNLPNGDIGLDFESSKTDSQHDIFEFYFMGHSGKFYIGKNKEILVTQKSGLKIIPNYYSSTIIGGELGSFTVIDESGMKFYFDKAVYSNNVRFGHGSYLKFISSWLLTRIETPYNEEFVRFDYIESATTTKKTELFPFQTYYKSPLYGTVAAISEDSQFIYYPAGQLFTSRNSQPVNELTLKSVEFSDKTKVFFEYFNENSEAPVLQKIMVKNAENKFAKGYQFFYAMRILGATYGLNPDLYNFDTYFDVRKTAILQSFKTISEDGSFKSPYKFEYFHNLPTEEQYDQAFVSPSGLDHWGFANEGPLSGDLSLIPTFPDDPSYYRQIPNREPNLAYTRIGALKKITYPTGGTQEFDYELNDKIFSPSSGPSYLGYVGGLRIKKITLHDAVNVQNDIITEYKYIDENGNSSGFLGDLPQYTQSYLATVAPNITVNTEIQFSRSIKELSYIDGSPVGYKRVEEIQKNGNTTNGKTVYEYSDITPSTLWDNFDTAPYCPIDRATWALGLPLKTKQYNQAGQLVKEVVNTYDIVQQYVTGDNYKSTHVAKIAGNVMMIPNVYVANSYSPTYIPVNGYSYYLPTADMYKFKNYYPVVGKSNLVSTVERLYASDLSGSFIETVKNFSYEPTYNQLRYTETINSDGKKIRSYFYYPYDYSNSAAPFIGELLAKNIINKAISNEVWLDYLTAPKLLNATVGDFTMVNNSVLRPSKIYQTQYAEPKPMAAAGTFDPSFILMPTRQLIPDMVFTKYDEFGRLTESMKEGGVKSVNMFDLTGNLILYATNASSDLLAYNSFDSNTDGGWTLNGNKQAGGITGSYSFNGTLSKTFSAPENLEVTAWVKNDGSASLNSQAGALIKTIGSWNLLKWVLSNTSAVTLVGTKLDEVRCYPAGAVVQTAVYKDGVGVIASCNEANVLSFYGYDQFNKPTIYKDEEGNILKQLKLEERKYYYNPEVVTPFIKYGNWFHDYNLSYTIEKGKLFSTSEATLEQETQNLVNVLGPMANNDFWEEQIPFHVPISKINVAVQIVNATTGELSTSVSITNPPPANSNYGFQCTVFYKIRYSVNGKEFTNECSRYYSQIPNYDFFPEHAYGGGNSLPPNSQILGVTVTGCYDSETMFFAMGSEIGKYFRKNDCEAGFIGSWVPYEVPITKRLSLTDINDAKMYAEHDLIVSGQKYANALGTSLPIRKITVVNNTTGKITITLTPVLSYVAGILNTNTVETFALAPGTKTIEIAEGNYSLNVSAKPNYGANFYLGTPYNISGNVINSYNLNYTADAVLTVNP